MRIGNAIVREIAVGQYQHQYRRLLRPAPISFFQTGQQLREGVRIFAPGHDKVPRLLIVRRRSPPGRRQHLTQHIGRYRAIGKGPRTPAPANQFMYPWIYTGHFNLNDFCLTCTLVPNNDSETPAFGLLRPASAKNFF